MSESTPVSLSQVSRAVTPQEISVPTDLVPMPSQGKVYQPGSPLAGKVSVEIRSMTARDEDILTSRALVRSGKVITSLLRSCLIDKDIEPEKMLVGDRNAAMIGVRITGYGAGYSIKVECPGCESEIKMELDLTTLPVKTFPADLKIETGKNEFSYTLPVSKKTCVFKLLTGEEERELLQILERGRKSGIGEELVTTRLKMQVIDIAGERDPQKLASVIRNMPAKDSRELRKYIDSITPGIELKTPFVCDACSFKGEVEVPLGTDFFWPES